jgi:hypothetical protein
MKEKNGAVTWSAFERNIMTAGVLVSLSHNEASRDTGVLCERAGEGASGTGGEPGASLLLEGVRNASYVEQWTGAASCDLEIEALTIASKCYLFVVRSISSSGNVLMSKEDRLWKINLFSTERKE